MLNSEEQETTLKALPGEAYDNVTKANLEETINQLK